MSLVILRYHEITLKGANRHRFAAALARNVRRACSDLPVGSVGDRHGRLVLELPDERVWPAVRERLARVFGIANFSLAKRLPMAAIRTPEGIELGPLERAVLNMVGDIRADSFRVVTRRADKRFPISSPDVSARIGAAIRAHTGMRVDLDLAELTITVELLPDDVFYSAEKVSGSGGLPIGTAGHVLALLSGGIDSPVAAARMMRRGCEVSLLHFHGAPYLDGSSADKCRELARRLAAYALDVRLLFVPFGEVQREIVTRVGPSPRVLLYRRMMVRIASELGASIGALALVTGDSLAQVASQTLANLAVVDDAARLPVLRPLVGMDKLEVSEEARRLGTFDVSIEPGEDCCSLFLPRHPVTRASLGIIRSSEAALDMPRLVGTALESFTVERFFHPDVPRRGLEERIHGARSPA